MADFDGRICVVTGSTRGIGRAIARRLHAEGATILGWGRDSEAGAELERELAGARFVRVDVTHRDEVQDAVQMAVEEHGGIDHLVCNAGITRDALLLRMSFEDWDRVLDVNLTGTFNVVHACLRSLLRRRNASIVALSSVVADLGNPGQANYAASKAGLAGFCRSVAAEIGGRGVRFNVLSPGFVETEMTLALPEHVRDAYLARIPLKRAASPAEIADATCFLLSSRASYITGQVLGVNGGLAP